ncbi:Hsp20/alpha crystallin family protein [Marinactinospora endophytica]
MLMRTDPFREFDRLTQRLLGDSGHLSALPMPMDAYRDGDTFVIHFDLPGVSPDSIDLEVERNVLTVRAERPELLREDREVVVTERPTGSFSRQLFLGETLDADGIDASYTDGVLTLRIPVAEQAKPRKISIASGGEQPRRITA